MTMATLVLLRVRYPHCRITNLVTAVAMCFPQLTFLLNDHSISRHLLTTAVELGILLFGYEMLSMQSLQSLQMCFLMFQRYFVVFGTCKGTEIVQHMGFHAV